jgi:biofilm PGA synthesis N-glycosyltransferase PgaC
VLQIVFWIAIGLIVYTHGLYGVITHLVARHRWRSHFSGDDWPPLTIVIAAYNEALVIGETIHHLRALDYPRERLSIVVVADGSSDATPTVLRDLSLDCLTVLFDPTRRGKAHAINRGVAHSNDPVIVFTDANTRLHHGSLKALVRHFADPAVGLVAGAKSVSNDAESAVVTESLYWRYESWLKQNDSRVQSVVGAAGEIFAMRRSLFNPLAEGTILDDFVLSIQVLQAGYRALYEATAKSVETGSASLADEFERKTRIVAGAYQAFGMLWPKRNCLDAWSVWQVVSHRLLRWMVVPFLFPVVLVCNVYLVSAPLYQLTLLGQCLFYFAAWRGLCGSRWRVAKLAFYYCFFQVAAIAGAWRSLTRTQSGTWERVRRADAA